MVIIRKLSAAAIPAAALAAVMALLVFSAAVIAATGPGVMLSWKPPKDVPASDIKGYKLYRSEKVGGHYDGIAAVAADRLDFEDRGGDAAAPDGLDLGRTYYYKVTTVFSSGTESAPTDPVGMVAGGSAGTGEYRLPEIKSFTCDSLGRVSYLGDTLTFILIGTPGLSAYYSIAGVTDYAPMSEVQPGTYKAEYIVPGDADASGLKASAKLEDAVGGVATSETPAELNVLGWKGPGLTGFYAGMVEADRVGLNWPRYKSAGGGIAIFRGTSPITGTEGAQVLTGNLSDGVSAYIDATVTAGTTYYYKLGLLDDKGQLADYTDNLKVTVPEAGKVSGINSVTEDSAGRELVPGDVLNVEMASAPGGKATFSLGDAARDVDMSEAEPGVYKGTYTVKEGDGVFSSKVAVSLREPDGNTRFSSSTTFVSLNAPRQTGVKPGSGPKPSVFGLEDDIQSVTRTSGRLTAGETFSVTLKGDPGMKGYFDLGESIWRVPMKELPDSPGTYVGEYTVKPGDNAGTSGDPMRDVYLTGYLESETGAQSDPARGAVPVIVDTTCNIAVEVSESLLPADASSRARVTFTVTDADGEPVRDRRLTVLLEPPPKYTGVVGSGGVGIFDSSGQDASNGGLGRLDLDFDDLTDSSGRINATYTSGFAAKTAMIVARDYATGSVGIGYITTELTSSVSIVLGDTTPPPTADPSAPVYQLAVDVVPETPVADVSLPYFMVNAIPDTLTADGRSRATVIATLTKDGVPVGGKRIIFAVSGAGGRLTAPSAVTDGLGRAQVFYIAGIKAGRALISATEPETGVTVTKTITLLADAPAKIFAKATPSSLPADGVSSSEIMVGVADVNNNPTEGIKLSYDIISGTGMLSDNESVTGTDGSSRVYYTAGTEPGVTTINITAVSEPPTADELDKAITTVNAPMVYDFSDFTEVRVVKWYRSIGDSVGRGEPLALVDTPNGEMKVYSPVTGTLDKITIEPGIYVMEGREIGVVAR